MQEYMEIKHKFPLNTVLIFGKLCCYLHQGQDMIYVLPRDKLKYLRPKTFMWSDILYKVSVYRFPLGSWNPDIKTLREFNIFLDALISDYKGIYARLEKLLKENMGC